VATREISTSSRKKRTALGKNISFVDNKKETVFYDGSGDTVLIFEKKS
jgi:hypothetical protein